MDGKPSAESFAWAAWNDFNLLLQEKDSKMWLTYVSTVPHQKKDNGEWSIVLISVHEWLVTQNN